MSQARGCMRTPSAAAAPVRCASMGFHSTAGRGHAEALASSVNVCEVMAAAAATAASLRSRPFRIQPSFLRAAGGGRTPGGGSTGPRGRT